MPLITIRKRSKHATIRNISDCVTELPAYPHPAANKGCASSALYKKRATRRSVSPTCQCRSSGAFPLKKRGFADKQNSLLPAMFGVEESLIPG
jgi:hypothetical protein